MKRVSPKVARVLREAGYPQGTSEYLYDDGVDVLASRYDYQQWNIDTSTKIDAPSVLEAWLWLWREKEIHIDIDNDFFGGGATSFEDNTFEEFRKNDPEEAIEKAIEYLCNNNLIK